MLTDLAPPRASAAQLAELADHLRLPGDHLDDPALARLLASCCEAAVLAAERRIGRALLRRDFSLRADRWPQGGIALPVGPIASLVAVVSEAADGARSVFAEGVFRIDRFQTPPRLEVAPDRPGPAIPEGGALEVVWRAGEAADWAGLAGDLRLAVTLIAASYYEDGPAADFPTAAAALLAPHRSLRL